MISWRVKYDCKEIIMKNIRLGLSRLIIDFRKTLFSRNMRTIRDIKRNIISRMCMGIKLALKIVISTHILIRIII